MATQKDVQTFFSKRKRYYDKGTAKQGKEDADKTPAKAHASPEEDEVGIGKQSQQEADRQGPSRHVAVGLESVRRQMQYTTGRMKMAQLRKQEAMLLAQWQWQGGSSSDGGS